MKREHNFDRRPKINKASMEDYEKLKNQIAEYERRREALEGQPMTDAWVQERNMILTKLYILKRQWNVRYATINELYQFNADYPQSADPAIWDTYKKKKRTKL